MSEVTAEPLDLASVSAPAFDLSRLPGPRVMRTGAVLAIILGLAAATGVMGAVGLADIARATRAIGVRGLAALVIWTPGPLLLLAAAWFLFGGAGPGPRPGFSVFVWARLIRDASGELLPFSHVGGFFIGARAAILRGLAPRAAFATSVADVSAELLAQLVFTGAALAWLAQRLGAGAQSLVSSALLGLVGGAVAVGLFMLLQGKGGRMVDRLAGQLFPALAKRSPGLGAAVQDLYSHPWRVMGATALHLAAWVASALGCWAALRTAGIRVEPEDILALEAVVAAARSALVVAPMGIGVQEATYAFAGPLLGVSPDLALALSLVKRARDLAVGIPALAAWQAMEGARALQRPRPGMFRGPSAPKPSPEATR